MKIDEQALYVKPAQEVMKLNYVCIADIVCLQYNIRRSKTFDSRHVPHRNFDKQWSTPPWQNLCNRSPSAIIRGWINFEDGAKEMGFIKRTLGIENNRVCYVRIVRRCGAVIYGLIYFLSGQGPAYVSSSFPARAASQSVPFEVLRLTVSVISVFDHLRVLT